METQNVLVINGHPDKISFNEEIAQTYLKEMEKLGIKATYMPIRDLNFDPNLKYGYRLRSELEPDLIKAIDLIKKSTHVVWIHPLWWFGLPALMKGFIDRTFLPSIAFNYTSEGELQQLLAGKSARIISTGDGDAETYEKVYHNSGIVQLKTGILEFTGFDPILVKYIAPIMDKTPEELSAYLNEVKTAVQEDFNMITKKAETTVS
ncbi:flavodoxin family protein [Chryseobacterium piperi]|uniref:NAD(P)H-dependent oxidoreductase n=1 Tax=Chryseobacterium piperi TaxID=558152 RepID=UPI0005534A04|nr:NAD(P)H-dependent oxidoreductase [Chryseobacterium piperi]ASW75250.1 flavodoxin family protein [Chryseobacterium piperi]